MLTMSSKNYAKHSGLPWRTVVSLCRQGVLPYMSIANGYFILVAQADEIVKETAIRTAEQKAAKIASQNRKITVSKCGSFADKIADLKSRTKQA